MDFEDTLKEKIKEFEACLRKTLPVEEGLQKTIFEAVNYSLLAGGKRLRPLIILESNRMFGGMAEQDSLVTAFACALEMIHTYSLVHDDLPAMDNDMYRRGKLTTHAKYGEDMGILAGDALLNYAFETASEAVAAETEPERLRAGARAMVILGKKAGMYGMLGGQVVDVEKTGNPLDKTELDFIYRLKTAALLEASFQIGAVLAGADESAMQQVEMIAREVGLAFQIQDDILDVTSSLEVLGKPIHSDEKNAKTTYVTLYSLDKAEEKVEELSASAIERLDALQCVNSKEWIRSLIRWLIHRTH